MKKVLLLTTILLLTLPLAAQKEEEHVVRRGHYRTTVTPPPDTIKKPKKHSDWYNNISFNALLGTHSAGIVEDPGGDFAYIPHKNVHYSNDTVTAILFSISYERLKRHNLLYYGPGVACNISCGDFLPIFSANIYLRGKYELNLSRKFLGYNLSGFHPYISAAVGARYVISDNKTLNRSAQYAINVSDYENRLWGNEVDYWGWYNYPTNGFKFYLDFGLGFAIDCGKHQSIIIGYRSILHPSVTRSVSIMDHLDEIASLRSNCINNHRDGQIYISTTPEEQLKLYHGIEVSFRF